MNNILGPKASLELLDKLQRAVADIGSRAAKLSEESRGKLARERLRTQAQIQEQQRSETVRHEEVRKTLERAAEDSSRRYEARKTRIDKAFHSSKEQRLKEIDDQLGAVRYESQKRMLQAERDREGGISAANKKRQEFEARLAEMNQRLGVLEHQAQRAFAGYGSFKIGFSDAYQQASTTSDETSDVLYRRVEERLAEGEKLLRRLRHNVLLRAFRPIWVWLVLAALALAAPFITQQLNLAPVSYGMAGGIAAGLAIAFLALRQAGVALAKGPAQALSKALAEGRAAHDATGRKVISDHEAETKRLQATYASTLQTVEQQVKRAQSQAGEKRVSLRMRIDEKTLRAQTTLQKLRATTVSRQKDSAAAALKAAEEATAALVQQLTSAGQERQKAIEAEYQHAMESLQKEWDALLRPIYNAFGAHNSQVTALFPEWGLAPLGQWQLPATMSDAARFGNLQASVDELVGGMPKVPGMTLPGPEPLEIKLALTYPLEGSLLLETNDTGRDQAIQSLNDVALRLLSSSPAGRLRFTILDPVGLGQNFAGVMHMADYEEQIINNRIWTQAGQIEQRLADLNEHMEKVIQMYLRNEYATIAEYNAQAGVIAEKYHFLVVADFPAGFSDVAAKRLASIAASGARCGVFMLIHWDRRLPMPQDFLPDELRKHCFNLVARQGRFEVPGKPLPGAELQLEMPPPPDQAIELVHRLGKLSRDSSRVEVPFAHVAPGDGEIWSEDTTTELRVPIGRTGATKMQYLAIGKGTCQHGLVAGKTGSGKSTLFHVIITNLALWSSPDQVEFYLVDFKKGVEFKTYATHRLPHARVVAIESDREFGLSVLERVDQELRRRGEMFRKLGVQDIAGYKRAGGKESIPRTLLLIDEFQEFFVEDDRVSQTAALLLDRIVRQGRAFGIHVLLGSQTLGGAYTIARTTLGQMVIRIALQCNEADAYLIMDESNPAPRLLSRPGEGIYNDTAGSIEGNSPFQVVWLPEAVRDHYLKKVTERAASAGKEFEAPIVFEGNAPADVRDNAILTRALQQPGETAPTAPRIWLGAPNSIKGPTEVVFERQSGSHLLVVGQSDETILAMLGIGLVSLAAQFSQGRARVILCDSSPPGSPARDFLQRVSAALPLKVETVTAPELPEVMTALEAELRHRSELPDPASEPPIFLLIHGLQRFSRLKHEEDFSFGGGSDSASTPGAILSALLTEGARTGIHVMLTVDSYSSLTRFMSRKAIGEFEMRVLFQMSANDSASLIDSPKAGLLGLHRALFQNAKQGWLETFRPYALPDDDWLVEVGSTLARRPTTVPQPT